MPDESPLKSPEFVEGYGEGLSAGVEMFAKLASGWLDRMPEKSLTADEFARIVLGARKNVEEWRERPMNI